MSYEFIKFLFALVTLLVFGNKVFCRELPKQHQGRFFGAYTATVIEEKIITSLIPSSCVQVEPTLPPCRNVRYMKFPTFDPYPKYASPEDNKISASVHTTALSWPEYLGIYDPTVTVTETKIRTTTVQDPKVVVTFAVRGCRPLKLPIDLDRCITPTIINEEIKPTATVSEENTDFQVVPTDSYQPAEASEIGDNSYSNQPNGVDLAPSTDDDLDSFTVKPTETLQSTEYYNN